MYVFFVCGGEREREVSDGVYITDLEVRGHLLGRVSPVLLRQAPSCVHHAAARPDLPGLPHFPSQQRSAGAADVHYHICFFSGCSGDRTQFSGLLGQALLPPELWSQLPYA